MYVCVSQPTDTTGEQLELQLQLELAV